MPSIVVTLEPAACPASTVQDFTARPSICTTQAPHWLVIAADMGAGQVEMLAQDMDQQCSILDLDRDRLAVHRPI